MDKKTGYLKLI